MARAKPGPIGDWSIVLNGKVTEAMQRQKMTKAELSRSLGLGDETLKRKGAEMTLSTLDFVTVALLIKAAGYEIEFRKA